MIDRHLAIKTILETLDANDLVISTTGMISREVFYEGDKPSNFYMLGSMGLLSAFGLGLAIEFPDKKIWILEGDGSSLMSLGTIPLIGFETPLNYYHIILDNESYESTGAQPSISNKINLDEISKASKYSNVARVEHIENLKDVIADFRNKSGPNLALVKCSINPVPDIPRISYHPEQIRDRFKNTLENGI